MKKLLLLIMLSGLWHSGHTQSKSAVEQYYFRDGTSFNFVPVASYETTSGWYTQGRYNYDNFNSLSLFTGKSFSGKKTLSYSVTPVIGTMIGQLNGGLLGFNFDLDYKLFSFSSQSEYTLLLEKHANKFFYNWSEIRYCLPYRFNVGMAMQQTNIYNTSGKFETGIFVQGKFNNWKFPLYMFNPGKNQIYFIVGLNYEWQNKKTQMKY